jgi:hypothetical protein
VFSPVDTQSAGMSFNITITAKDASNNTLTNYVGTNTLNVSIGTVSPISTGAFLNGVWAGSVTVTGAGSGITLFTTGSGMTGTSSIFTVNPGALSTFNFSPINSPQTAGSTFSITVTAKDAYGNNVIGYVGTPSLTISAGSISPGTMATFISGVGSTLVTVTGAGSDVTITATDGGHSGASNSFTVTISPTSTPSSTSTQTTTSTPKPKNTPATPTSAPKLTPSPTPSETTVKANTDSGATVDLAINGNITISQISNLTIVKNESAASIVVSFTVTGEDGTIGFSNMTFPKSAVSNGDNPIVFIDGQKAQNQGYTQDTTSFYVWYSTEFSTHQVTTQFTLPSTSSTSSFGPLFAICLTIPEIVLIYTVIAVRRLRQRPENE